jgi:hypothetical protein
VYLYAKRTFQILLASTTFVLNVLLTVHHNISVQQDQQDTLFVFSFLQINRPYMFRALFANHQETLHMQQLE